MTNNDWIETDERRNSFQKSESIERVSVDRETEHQKIHNLNSSSIGSSKEFISDNTKEENIDKVAGNSSFRGYGNRDGEKSKRVA